MSCSSEYQVSRTAYPLLIQLLTALRQLTSHFQTRKLRQAMSYQLPPGDMSLPNQEPL